MVTKRCRLIDTIINGYFQHLFFAFNKPLSFISKAAKKQCLQSRLIAGSGVFIFITANSKMTLKLPESIVRWPAKQRSIYFAWALCYF